uniref:Uncharacterized protein n=1 Tax=Arundo donax TaxID=35708 RepID=A0A0A9H1G2_ARUDO
MGMCSGSLWANASWDVTIGGPWPSCLRSIETYNR